MKITVITPTIRPNGLDIVKRALAKQTFKDFEWLIGSPFDPKIESAKWVEDNFPKSFWSLNRIYNKLFKEASGEIIVTWQDWIYAPPDTLEKLVNNLERCGKQALISGVGDQFETVNKWGKPQIKIWSDPRRTDKYGSFYMCHYNDCEWNLAGFWKENILSVGGMDEQLDFLGYGGDQLQICDRLNANGSHFYLDQTMESSTVRHDRSDFGGQEKWDDNHVLFRKGESGKSLYDERKAELHVKGLWPVIK